MTGALYGWLLETTLKGSILILAVAVLQRLIGARVDARWRHLLWIIVLVRLVLPAAPSSSVSLFQLIPSSEPAAIPRIVIMQPRAAAPLPTLREVVTVEMTPYRSSIPWIVGIWLAGALFFASRTTIAAVRMRRAIPDSREPGAESRIPIIETDAVRTPALHGVIRPVLLLPRGFATSFTAGELRHVVLHETWHVKRMDVAVSWLLAVAQCLHWFNPLVWFAGARIREERELACDELALSSLEEDERPDYGRTILKLLERFRAASPLPVAVGIIDRKERMKRRLTMIASFRNGTRFTALFLLLAGAVAVAGLTDPPEVHRKFIKKLDPAAHATMERLHQSISFELTNGSLHDLLTTVSNKTGLPVIQDAALATLPVQNARFTIKADAVPAKMVLREALAPFELAAEPAEGGVTIVSGPGRHRRVMVKVGEEGKLRNKEAHVIRIDKSDENDRVVEVVEKTIDGGEVEQEVQLRVDKSSGKSEDGRILRDIKVKIDQNGVVSEGKLTIEIDR